MSRFSSAKMERKCSKKSHSVNRHKMALDFGEKVHNLPILCGNLSSPHVRMSISPGFLKPDNSKKLLHHHGAKRKFVKVFLHFEGVPPSIGHRFGFLFASRMAKPWSMPRKIYEINSRYIRNLFFCLVLQVGHQVFIKVCCRVGGETAFVQAYHQLPLAPGLVNLQQLHIL